MGFPPDGSDSDSASALGRLTQHCLVCRLHTLEHSLDRLPADAFVEAARALEPRSGHRISPCAANWLSRFRRTNRRRVSSGGSRSRRLGWWRRGDPRAPSYRGRYGPCGAVRSTKTFSPPRARHRPSSRRATKSSRTLPPASRRRRLRSGRFQRRGDLPTAVPKRISWSPV